MILFLLLQLVVHEISCTASIITPKERTLTGKRSDPDWKQRSVLLKNDSFEQARDLVRRKYNGRDFSELRQALLDQWLHTEMPS